MPERPITEYSGEIMRVNGIILEYRHRTPQDIAQIQQNNPSSFFPRGSYSLFHSLGLVRRFSVHDAEDENGKDVFVAKKRVENNLQR
jgi:hypothetical protein